MANGPDKPKILLFHNKSFEAGGNRPVKQGFGEIDKASLAKFNAAMDASPDGIIKLETAAWERTSGSGNAYLFVTFELENPKYASKSNTADRPTGATHGGADDVPF